MRYTALTIFITLASALAAAPAASAQQHELSLLAGATTPAAQISAPSFLSVSGGVSVSAQLNYAYVLRRLPSGDFLLEFPASRVAKASVSIRPASVGAGQSQFFFTPGVRYRLLPESRVSPYVVSGFGFGWFDGANIIVEPAMKVDVDSGFQPVFGFGGGLELRATRWFGFKAELRDFVRVGGNSTQRHHLALAAGLSFRF